MDIKKTAAKRKYIFFEEDKEKYDENGVKRKNFTK